MVEQKGAVIFWPWDYHIDELLKQHKDKKGFGWSLDFKIEEYDTKNADDYKY
jgi:hypothetical protein